MADLFLKSYWNDLRCFTLFPKRYKTPQGLSAEHWHKVTREYGNMQKRLRQSDMRWRIITYDDGRRELAYLKERSGGLLTGMTPAIYRGIIFPKMIRIGQFAHIKDIRIAF